MFTFLDFPCLQGEEIELRLTRTFEAVPEKNYVPSYYYTIFHRGRQEPAGYIDLRVGENENLFYGGHIGYRVHEPFRGHGYAGCACRLLVPLAKAHGMLLLRITCNPDNIASKRTIEKLGAAFCGIFEVPPHNELYLMGERLKCIFEWDISAL